MPSREVEFIGRERELDLILKAICHWGTNQTLFVHGRAGVGKTSLLRRVHEQLHQKMAQCAEPETGERRYRILSIIDLDDVRLHSPTDISLMIISQLGMERFGQYVQELQALQHLEQVYSVRISEQKGKVEEAFIKCYGNISRDVRTVLFCDTTDAIETAEGQEALDYLVSLSRNLKNVVVVFSGRNAHELYDASSQDTESTHTRFLPVGPLSPEASHEYLRCKQELLHIVMDSESEREILLLSRGLPFLIDLAAEWRARAIPVSWLAEETLQTQQSMSEEEAERRREDFEARLVQHIVQLRRPLDRLALALARVHPVDVELCARLLDLSERQAEELVTDAQSIAFVKTLPDGQIKLHDYMEYLVLTYVWPNIEEDRKKRDSERAVQYFENKLRELSRRRDSLSDDLAESEAELADALDAFLMKEVLERKYWRLGTQLVEHALVVDANKGARIFCGLFDEAVRSHRVSVLDHLTTLVMEYEKQLQWDASFEVGVRWAQTLERRREYSAAEKVVNAIIKNENISPKQQIKALIRRGNVGIRLPQEGAAQAGLDDLDEAIKIARANELPEELGQAELEVGWAYSNRGDWTEANRHLQEALELALETGNHELEAMALNELACTTYEDCPRALSLCTEAIRLWIVLEDRPGLGRSYSNMGTILYRAADYGEALEYFQRSKEIFEPARVTERIGILASWQGITYCAQAEGNMNAPESAELLRQAEELVTRAIDTEVHRERARNLNRLARVYRFQARYDEAWQQLLGAYAASIEIPDFIYEIASLRDLCSMALELDDYDTYDDLRMKLAKVEARGAIPGGPGYGGTLINIGIMGVYLGDSEFGFRSIAHGLKAAAESGSYANHTFARTLETFKKHAAKLVPPGERRELAANLKLYWDREGLSRKYIEAVRAFYQLQTGQIDL